ncbi:MAG: hypothetical protein DRJ96_07155 [Thermoprotei archaeon]|nr:MAG: hypothetical protein DRJ67_07785 [Thermoprotei archaeon]RLE96248.1 MAG: hypothetical protein DRJ96_07155 [Thermoprotei archaeon]
MVKYRIDEKALMSASCEALQYLATAFRLMGRLDAAQYIEDLMKSKGCPVQGQAPQPIFLALK